MHPSSALIVWLLAVLAVQFIAYTGMGLLVLVILLSSANVVRSWVSYLSRARWLLLTLWLILAYNTPGEAFRDLMWAPTYEGIAEANMQVTRLIVMLACLAWLFARLGREGLVSALWGLLEPLRRWGADTQRLVVRLSLVLDNLQTPPEKGAWRRMLLGDSQNSSGPTSLHLILPRWTAVDTLIVAAGFFMLMGVFFW